MARTRRFAVVPLLSLGLIAGSILATAAPASAASSCKFQPCLTLSSAPDLTVGVTASPNPVSVSGTHTYGLTVTNTTWAWSLIQAPHPVWGATLSNVRVHLNSYPSDETLVSAHDDTGTGFICYTPAEYFGMDVRCVSGTVPSGSSAHITLTMRAPTRSGAYSATATVDPYGEIAEYSESNNTAAVSFSAI